MVFADKARIEQVVTNLITNAIKYSPDSQEIQISILFDGMNVTIAVSDQGIGISKEEISKLFSRFYRVPGSSAIASGSGMGLYLCKKIIAIHNGEIWVESEPGQGSTFYFSLRQAGE